MDDVTYCDTFNRRYGSVANKTAPWLTPLIGDRPEDDGLLLIHDGMRAVAPSAEMRKILESTPEDVWWTTFNERGYIFSK
jgi:hypothetical protein